MHAPTRRSFLLASATALVGSAGCASDDGTDNGTRTETDSPKTGARTPTRGGSLSSLSLTGESVATGFTAPVGVAVPRAGEVYVLDQSGVVYRVGDTGRTVAADLRDRVVDVSGYDERGLLGMAVDPSYDGTGRAYLRYSAPPREGTPSDYSHTFVLSEFRLSGGDIDPGSERVLLEVPQPQANHNAGAVGFGPDGHLYVAVGDGGGANDQGRGHASDWYDPVSGGNGQDVTSNLLGSLLRIDPTADGDRPYTVPADNPLVGRPGRDEQYAWGFRNPWRFSFGPDGRLLVADVGQSRYEEVNVVEKGGNYGWNVREGRACFQREACPAAASDGQRLREPVIQYPHDGGPVSGISVIGGYVYRGDAVSALADKYVFADWRAGGRLFVATRTDGPRWPVTTVELDGDAVRKNVLSFGETPAGELLVCSTARGGVAGSTGAVHRLVPA